MILKPRQKGKNQPLWLSCSLVYLCFLLKMVIDANNANIFGVSDWSLLQFIRVYYEEKAKIGIGLKIDLYQRIL